MPNEINKQDIRMNKNNKDFSLIQVLATAASSVLNQSEASTLSPEGIGYYNDLGNDRFNDPIKITITHAWFIITRYNDPKMLRLREICYNNP